MPKLGKLVNSVESLNKLLRVSLPVKIAYKIGKLALRLEPEIKIFNDGKNKLITELGEEVDGVPTINQKSANWSKFVEEVGKLENIEVDLNYAPDKPLEKLSLSDLGDISLEAADLLQLDWLISD